MRGRDEHKRDMVAFVRKSGACSRPEIASKLELNLATVSGLTRELLSDGILMEQGHTPSEGGRRAGVVDLLNPQAVVFGGLLGKGHRQFNGAIKRSFRSRVLRAFESTLARLARLGDDAASVGAACLVFDERFRSGAFAKVRERVQGGKR